MGFNIAKLLGFGMKQGATGVSQIFWAILKSWQFVLALIFGFILIAPTITPAIGQRSAKPLFEGVVKDIGGAGVHFDEQAVLIEENNYKLPIDVSEFVPYTYERRTGFFGFFYNTFNIYKSWAFNFFSWMSIFLLKLGYVFKLLGVLFWTFYIGRFFYMISFFKDSSRRFRAWMIGVSAVVLVQVVFGIYSAFNILSYASALEFVDKLFLPVTGYVHFIKVIIIMFGGGIV
jgi:hypothetical protein